MYAGGLYLAQPSKDAGAVVAADAPKRVRMVFLRSVDKAKILEAYREGFEKNSAGPGLADLLAKLDRIAAAIPAELKEGAEMSVTYVPGEGTTVSSAGGGTATVPGKEFARRDVPELARQRAGRRGSQGGDAREVTTLDPAVGPIA